MTRTHLFLEDTIFQSVVLESSLFQAPRNVHPPKEG
jgi:hypothetical protein